MEKAYDYLLYGQIQELKIKYYQESGSRLSFREAVEELVKAGAQKHGLPDLPDFLSWNLHSCKELRTLIAKIPVPLSDVLQLGYHASDDVMYLSTKHRVQISQESCYMSRQLISTEHFSFLYVLEGGCLLSVERTVRSMKPGELCILPPGTAYAVFTEPKDLVINIISDRDHFEENFRLLLYHDNIVSDFFRRALFLDVKEEIYFMLPLTRDLRSIIQHLFAEFVKKDAYSDLLFNNYLQIFYANIIRSTQSTYHYYADQKKISAKILMPAILEYINENYHTLSLEILAAHFHYESAYLSKLIRASTGKNYSAIVAELKVKEASKLLLHTDMKIEEIAEAVGYNSADHFSYSFNKAMGVPPRVYKNKR